MSNFHVGQKVTMIVDFPAGERTRAAQDGVSLPRHGEVYTILNMEPGANPWTRQFTFIRFVELVNGPHLVDGFEPSFDSRLFRPVVERKTDISVFKAMLEPKKGKVEA